MHRNQLRSLLTLLVALVLVFVVVAPVDAAGDAFCVVVVKLGDTLTGLANEFNTSVFLIVRENELPNENLILPGTVLKIRIGIGAEGQCPTDSSSSGDSSTTTTAITSSTATTSTTATTTAQNTNAGKFNIVVSSPLYSYGGTQVEIAVTVHNISVTPSIAGGKETAVQEDGYRKDMTLAKASHDHFETPLFGDALIWQAIVHTSDGRSHTLGVGCQFIEHVYREGIEPLTRDEDGTILTAYYYEVNLYDGWFDCGNVYRVNPEDIAPGTSGSSVLTIYLVNPHYLALEGRGVGDPSPLRYVTQLDFTLFTPSGTVAGTQTVLVDPPQTAG